MNYLLRVPQSISSNVSSFHYYDVIRGGMASQITSLTIVYSSVYSGADQRKHQSSVSLAFVRGIHWRPVNSPHKGPARRKIFPFDDVIIQRKSHRIQVHDQSLWRQVLHLCWIQSPKWVTVFANATADQLSLLLQNRYTIWSLFVLPEQFLWNNNKYYDHHYYHYYFYHCHHLIIIINIIISIEYSMKLVPCLLCERTLQYPSSFPLGNTISDTKTWLRFFKTIQSIKG